MSERSEKAFDGLEAVVLRYADVESEPEGDEEFDRVRVELRLAALGYAREACRETGEKTMASAWAAAIAAAKTNGGGNNIRDGLYVHEVLKLMVEKKRGGVMFIGEMQVLEAQKTDPGIEPNAVGSTVGYVVNIDPVKDVNGMGLGNVKAFLAALLNTVPEKITPEQVDEAINQDPNAKRDDGTPMPVQPYTGRKIYDEAYTKPMKTKTGNFTHHKWAFIPPDVAASSASAA